MSDDAFPAADFKALPLEYLISAPLVAVVKAQKDAAVSTKDFIMGFMDKVDDTERYKPQTVNFNLKYQDTNAAGQTTMKAVQMDVPLLSIVPIPHLRFDSLTTHFKYEVSQVGSTKREKSGNLDGSAGIKYLPFVDVSLKGSLATTSSEQSTTNRSGSLEITVHASEAPMPEGLARLLSIMAKMVDADVAAAPAAQ